MYNTQNIEAFVYATFDVAGSVLGFLFGTTTGRLILFVIFASQIISFVLKKYSAYVTYKVAKLRYEKLCNEKDDAPTKSSYKRAKAK